jgi:hypothetical protein
MNCECYDSWTGLCMIHKIKCHPSGTCCYECDVNCKKGEYCNSMCAIAKYELRKDEFDRDNNETD